MIQTNCAGCVFATITDDKQTGCQLGRLDKLGTTGTYDADGVSYSTVARFCNTFRPEKWVTQLTIDEALNPIDTVMKEVEPRVGFLIYLDASKEGQDALEDLKITLDGIKNQEQGIPRYIIVATEKVEYNEGVHELLLSLFDKEETDIFVLQLLYRPNNKAFIVDEAFRFALNGWLYFTTSGEPVDKCLLKDLNEHINTKLKKLSVVLPYDDQNGFLVQTALFKYLNGNRTKVWDVNTQDSRLFLEKAKELDKGGDCILTWSQVNAS